jgi:hypothetical protein
MFFRYIFFIEYLEYFFYIVQYKKFFLVRKLTEPLDYAPGDERLQ